MGDKIKITMFAYDNAVTKRFNRLFLENFVKQPNCSVDLWNKLKEEVDNKSYSYIVKDNAMYFQTGKIDTGNGGFIIIWGYNLNDEDVNDNDFKKYVNEKIKGGVKIVNKVIDNTRPQPVVKPKNNVKPVTQNNDDIVYVPNAKTLEEYFWKERNSGKDHIIKYEIWDGGGEKCDVALFNLIDNTIEIILGTCDYLLPEYKQAMRNRAKELGMSNVRFFGAPAPDYSASK